MQESFGTEFAALAHQEQMLDIGAIVDKKHHFYFCYLLFVLLNLGLMDHLLVMMC